MRYQLLPCADHGGQPRHGERAVASAAEPLAGGAAGTAGLQWLWGLVELHLSQAEPGPAA
jgi:hypothetical protein